MLNGNQNARELYNYRLYDPYDMACGDDEYIIHKFIMK